MFANENVATEQNNDISDPPNIIEYYDFNLLTKIRY